MDRDGLTDTPRRAGTSRGRHAAPRRSASGSSRLIWVGVGGVVIVLLLGAVAYGWSRRSSAAVKPSTAQASTTQAPAAKAPATSTSSSSAKTASSTGSTAAAKAKPVWQTADPAWMDKYRGKLIYGFKPEPGYKAVALTFDDGPNGETKYVIDTLKKVGGQATFFDSGRKLAMSWAKTQPTIIDKAGFEIANHTQHHTIDGVSSLWHRTLAVDLAEINGPDVYVKKALGRPTVWLRPMGGMIDATGVKAANQTNHLVINWTIDSNDSHGGPRTPDYIYGQVTNNIKSGDVVLLHVTHPESMKALPKIVAELDRQGFKLVTLSELAQNSTAPITGKIPK